MSKIILSLFIAIIFISAGTVIWIVDPSSIDGFPDWIYYPIRAIASFAGFMGAMEILNWGFRSKKNE